MRDCCLRAFGKISTRFLIPQSALGFPFFPDFQLPGKRKIFEKISGNFSRT